MQRKHCKLNGTASTGRDVIVSLNVWKCKESYMYRIVYSCLETLSHW